MVPLDCRLIDTLLRKIIKIVWGSYVYSVNKAIDDNNLRTVVLYNLELTVPENCTTFHLRLFYCTSGLILLVESLIRATASSQSGTKRRCTKIIVVHTVCCSIRHLFA